MFRFCIHNMFFVLYNTNIICYVTLIHYKYTSVNILLVEREDKN